MKKIIMMVMLGVFITACQSENPQKVSRYQHHNENRELGEPQWMTKDEFEAEATGQTKVERETAKGKNNLAERWGRTFDRFLRRSTGY